MKKIFKEHRFYAISFVFLLASLAVAVISNICFEISKSPNLFAIFNIAYCLCFLICALSTSIFIGHSLAHSRHETSFLIAINLFVLIAIPAGFMVSLLLVVSQKQAPDKWQSTIAYMEEHQLLLSILFSLSTVILSFLGFYFAKKYHQKKK